MTRAEFLDQLQGALSDFPAEEREDALKFYEEYLDEAGPENEGVVLAELGSPERVARVIRANVPAGAGGRRARRPAASGLDWRAPKAPAPPAAETRQAQEPPPQSEAQPAPAGAQSEPYTDGARGQGNRVLWLILLIATFPIWFGLIGGLFGGAMGLAGGLIGVVVAGFATMFAGFVSLGASVGLLVSRSVPNGLLMMGLSLLCISAGSVMANITLWAFKKFVPAVFRCFGSVCRAIIGKVRGEQ